MVLEKPCTRCRTTQPLTEFDRNNNAKDGLQHHCKSCRRIYTNARRAQETEQESAARKLRYREYYAANREVRKAASKAHRLANPEMYRETKRKYYAKPAVKAAARISKQKSAAKHREQHNLRCRQKAAELKAQIIGAYGNACYCCGESDPIFLTVDHINGDGKEHRRSLRHKSRIYRWLRDNGFPKDNFRLACMNCNMGAYINGGNVCPHKLKAAPKLTLVA